MKLNEIFENLAYGELSQISIGGLPAGVIDENNWPNLLSHVNLGLKTLYSRFTLKTGRVTIGLLTAQKTYRIHSDYSVHSLRLPLSLKYILDDVDDRFKDDIIKMERVISDPHPETRERYELPINDSAHEYSVFTPTLTTLRIPDDVVDQRWNLPQLLKTDNLEIHYRAAHQAIYIPIGYFDPTRVEVELPPTHLMALLLFVASRINNPIGMNDEFKAGTTYAALFEQECQRLEGSGIQIDQGEGNSRLVRAGWA